MVGRKDFFLEEKGKKEISL